MLPAASQATSVGRLKRYGSGAACGGGAAALDGFRPAAQHHHHAAFGIELDDHVDAFVDGPDIVLRIDAHRVGERRSRRDPRRSRARSCPSRRIRRGAWPGCACRRRCVPWNWWRRRCLRPGRGSAAASGSSAPIEGDLRNVLRFGAGVELRRRQPLRGRLCELGQRRRPALPTPDRFFVFISLLLFIEFSCSFAVYTSC